MPQDTPTAVLTPQLCQRYSSLVWYCLEADLHKTALFYAERYFDLDPKNHDARHLYATALLHAGQPHSAHYLVNLPPDSRCTGCVEIIAKCCTKLGRHRQAREALETCLRDRAYSATRTFCFCATGASRLTTWRSRALTPAESMGMRAARSYPDEAVLCCQAGHTALKGNLHQSAAMSYRQALALNPLLWEAFEGLCAIGAFLQFFPARPCFTRV